MDAAAPKCPRRLLGLLSLRAQVQERAVNDAKIASFTNQDISLTISFRTLAVKS
jgi:hypothetical protein